MHPSRQLAPVVFVMNVYYTGLGIARNLHGRGVDVYGLSSERTAPGMRSRFFKGIYMVPNGRDEPAALCRRLVEIKQYHMEAPVIFPTRDFDVLFLHEYRHQLSPFYRLPQNSAVTCLLDKLELANVARASHVPIPATHACSSHEELERGIGRIAFPVVVKPRRAYQWRQRGVWEAVGARKAFLVESADRLRSEYQRLAPVSPEILIQEYISGSDTDIVVCCCYINGRHDLLAHFTARKLRQNPPLFGTGCAIEAVQVPEIVPLAKRLLEASGYSGVAEVEFKHDKSANKFYLIEINPRHWDQHELGSLLGVNVSWVAYRDVIGQTPAVQAPVYQSTSLYRWIAETEACSLILRSAYVQIQEARELSGQRGGRLTRYVSVACSVLAEIFFLSKGHKIFGIFHLRDPVPGILLCVRGMRELFRILVRYAASACGAGAIML